MCYDIQKYIATRQSVLILEFSSQTVSLMGRHQPRARASTFRFVLHYNALTRAVAGNGHTPLHWPSVVLPIHTRTHIHIFDKDQKASPTTRPCGGRFSSAYTRSDISVLATVPYSGTSALRALLGWPKQSHGYPYHVVT